MAAFPPGVSLGDGAPHSIMAPQTLPLKSEKRDKEQQFKQQQQNLLLQQNPPTCEPVDESDRRPSCISASAAITPPPVGETTPARAAGAVETPGAAAATETEGCLLQWFPGFDLPIGLKGRAILRRVLNQRRSLDAARCKQILSEHGIVLGRGVPGHTTNWGGLTVKELLHAAHLLGCWRQVEELCLSFCCSNGLKIEWVKELRAKGPHQVTLANLLSMKRNAAAEARRKRQQHTSTNAAAATSSSGASVAAAAATPHGKSGPTPEDIASATTVASTAATAAEGPESKLTIPGRRGGARQATPGLKLRKSCSRARKGRIDYQQQQQQQHVQEGESTNSSTPTAAAAATDTNFSCSMPSLPLHPQTEDMPIGGAPGGHSQQQQQQQHILQSQPTAPENALVEGAFAPELCRSPRETPLRPSHGPPVFDSFEGGTRRSSNSRRNSRRQQQQQQKPRLLPMHAPPSGAPHHSGEAAAPAADVVPAFCTGISSWSGNYGGALHDVTELKGTPEGPPPGMPIGPPFGASTWCVQQQELQQQDLQQQELQQQELQQQELQQQEQRQQQQPEQQHEQHQQLLLHHEQQQGASHMVFPDFQWTSGACAGEKKQEIAATASQPPPVPARAATAAEAAAAAAAQQLQLEDCYIETSYLYADTHQGTTISDAAAAAIPSEPSTAVPPMYDWSNHFQKAGNMQQQQTHLGAPQQWLSPMLPNYSGPPPPPPPSPRFSLPHGEMPGVTPLQLCAAQPPPSLASPCPLQLGKNGGPHDSSSDVSCASWRIKGSRNNKSSSSSNSCGVVPNYSGRVASNSSAPQRRTATRGTQPVAASRSRHRAKSGEAAAADAAAAVATGYQQHRGAPSGIPSLQQLLASSSSDSCSCCSASSGDEDTPYPSLLPSQSVGFQYGEKEPLLQQQPQQIPLGSYVTTAVAGRVQEGMTKAAALGVPPSLHVSSPQRPWLHPPGIPYVEGFISGTDAAPAAPGETAVEGTADSHATAQSYEGWWAGTDTPLLLSPGHTPVGAPPWNPSDTTHILFRNETLQQQQQQQSFSLQPQQQQQLSAQQQQQPHQQQRQHTLLPQQEVTPGALHAQAQCAQQDEWGSSGPTSSSNSFPTDPNAVNLHGVTAAAATATDAAAVVSEPVAVALQPDAADMHTAPPLLLQRKQQLQSLEQQQQQHNMQQPRQRRRAKGNGAERQVQKRQRNDSSRNTKRSEQQQPQKLLLQQEMNPCFPVQTQAQQQMLLQQAAVSNPQTAGICCSSSNLLRQQVSSQLQQEQEDYAASTAVGVGVSEAYSAVAAGQLFQSPWPLNAADPTAAAAAAACGSSGAPQGALQVAPPT